MTHGKARQVTPEQRRSAISIVPNLDRRVLAVWNRRFSCWSLPGGKAEEGETVEAAQRRELLEETSLETMLAAPLYQAPSAADAERAVHVFLVHAAGEPRETEPGCPVMWMTWMELCQASVFAPFYRKMHEVLDGQAYAAGAL